MARTTPVNSGYTIINGTSTGSNAAYVDCWLEYKVTSQNVTNNCSVLDVYLYSASRNSSSTKWESAEQFGWVGYDNGNKSYRSTTYDFSGNKVNCFGHSTYTIPHSADGTKTITLQGSWSTSHSSYISGGSVSQSVSLPSIARATAPVVSVSSAEFNQSITITLNRAASTFTHTLNYSFGSASGTIGTGIETSKTWTIPNSLMNQIPNAESGYLTITCITYNGSSKVGTKTTTITANVPASVVPSATVANSDPTGNKTTYGGYVKGKSKFKIDVTAAGTYSSTIKAYAIEMNGSKYTTASATSDFIVSAGSNTVKVTVTDSRGRKKVVSSNLSVLDYSAPTITAFSAIRCTSSGAADENGEYIKATVKASITALNNHNGKQISVKYKQNGASSYTTAQTWNAYSVDSSCIFSASADNAFFVTLEATDDFGNSSKTVSVGTAFTLVDYRSTGKGMAVGQVSSKDRFQVGIESEFIKNIHMSPDNDIQKNILFENAGNDTYKHDCSIYGGNGSSTTGIGFCDIMNSRTILAYNDVSNTLYTESILRNHFISVCLQTSTTISTTDETTLAMKTVRYEQDASGILSVSGNGILCAKDGYILVSASAYLTTGVVANGIYQLLLRKNSSGYIQRIMQRVPGTYHSISIPAVLCSVSAGEVITLGIKAQSGSGVVVNNGNDATNLSVMYVG